MLKLRKNKKGFTLVELIVVIAIMAVLAGVVAGVTVSQLNKQTDKTNQSQAKTIADFISTKIVEESYDFDKLDGFLGTDNKIVAASGIGKALTDQYGDKIVLESDAEKGKTISVKFATDHFEVEYKGKTDSGNIKYSIDKDAVVKKI